MKSIKTTHQTIKQRFTPLLITLFSLFMLAACGGGSGSDGNPAPVVVGANLAVTVTNNQGQQVSQYPVASTINVNVLATNEFGRAAANVTVTFDSTLGVLSQTTGLTDSSGRASANLVTTINDLGASILTATATVGGVDLTASKGIDITTAVANSLSLTVLDETCANQLTNVAAGSTVCVKAGLFNDNTPIVGEVINFTTTQGTARQTSALTDAGGIATILIDSDTTILGAATVTASSLNQSTSQNFQYTEFVVANLSLTVLDASCTTPVDTTIATSTLCLKAELTRNGTPQIAQIITFTAPLGTVRQATSLTDNNGVATVFLDTIDTDIGASTATANFTTANDAVSATDNYQLTAASPQSVPTAVSVSIYDSSCTTETNSFTAGTTVCLQAILVDDEVPVANEIITFAAPLGSLRQSTALTNTAGIARVLLDSNDTQLGAAAANVSFATLIGTANYEFTSGNSQPIQEPTIELSTLQDGTAKNRFRVGENIQLQATVNDGNNSPLQDSIIRFTAERGQLATDSALTDINGQAQVTLTAQDADVGAAVATALVTINQVNFTKSFNYEVLAGDAVEADRARIGHFDSQGVFVNGVLGTSLVQDANGDYPLSAGGTTGFTVAVVDQNDVRIITPTPVTFTSACANNGNVNLDSPVSTINGEASSTYEDISCASVSGNVDTIVATITVNSVAVTANRVIKLLPEAVGSIEFISADPQNIVLQGTGGQGNQESSTLTFLVKGVLGNPLSQQPVDFSLDTQAGGLSISPLTSLTNSQGLVTTRVSSGTSPAAVRVTASTTVVREGELDQIIRTQSDLLSVNTGLPDQNSITLSAEVLNPEAATLTGREVTITAYMADSANNPVPDGTTVNFTTEGGFIDGDCNTTNGSCSVTWKGVNPRLPNHRSTVLAYAIGHETFFDTNGNNVFDDEDGGALTDNTDSGLDRSNYHPGGFIDHQEAWRDDNENRIFDGSDQLIDFNGDTNHDAADGKFNGPNCTHATLCGEGTGQKINVRKALVLIMSSNNVVFTLMTDQISQPTNTNPDHIGNSHILSTNDGNVVSVNDFVTVDVSGTSANTDGLIILEEGFSLQMSLALADDAQGLGQTLPVGTTVTISTSFGQVTGSTNFTIPNTVGYIDPLGIDRFGGTIQSFSLVNTNSTSNGGDTTQEGVVTFLFAFPDSNTISNFTIPFRMIGR